MSTATRDWLMLAVVLVGALSFAYYYVVGVLARDRLVSRAAVVAFLLCGGVAAVLLLRLLS